MSSPVPPVPDEERSDKSFRDLFHLFSDIVSLIWISGENTPGNYVEINEAGCRALGYSREELLSMTPLDLLVSDDHPTLPSLMERLGRDRHVLFECTIMARDGRRIPTETNSHLIDVEGRPAILSISRDITERRRAQADTARASHLASLGELAAGVAHEINNPINGIINYAQLLANRLPEGVKDREIAERIIREGNRIAVIVRNLLSFARERREIKRPVTIQEILTDVLALVEAQLTRDGIRLTVEVPEDLPPVEAIRHHFQQVFLNLISNSRYALNEKFPSYHREKELIIRAAVVGEGGAMFVRTVFEDRGTGISPRILDKVMNPFFTTKPADQGTGLGLSISLGIVRDHGGSFEIESREGEFTRVLIELPAVSLPVPDRGDKCPSAF